MNVVCAKSVSFAKEAFEALGNLDLLAEHEISPEHLETADVLVTRSKTPLTPSLFANSPARVAATCTAGVDHVDRPGLESMGIRVVSAPGCNANAVSEYIVASLLEAYRCTGFHFAGSTLGIVGHGNVGKRVEEKAKALGMRVLLNDPPLEQEGLASGYCSMEQLLAESDVLTLHVPLVESGPFPTRLLIGDAQLAQLRPGAIFLNACRGEVVDHRALVRARSNHHLSFLGLDVWDPEPCISEPLLEVADLATAHIAGHSVEGKVNGTLQVRQSICEIFGLHGLWDPTPLLPPPTQNELRWPGHGTLEDNLLALVSSCYDIVMDDGLLRQNTPDRGALFTSLRRNYRHRREWSATKVHGVPAKQTTLLSTLGFFPIAASS